MRKKTKYLQHDWNKLAEKALKKKGHPFITWLRKNKAMLQYGPETLAETHQTYQNGEYYQIFLLSQK